MRLEDKEVEKAICYKLGEFGNYELKEEDLSRIEELNLSDRSFSGKEKNINLSEISQLKNLKNITLQYFKIDDSIAQILNSLENLSSIQFASCEFDITQPFLNHSLRSLSFESCDINDYEQIFATESFRVVGDSKFSLKRLKGKENILRMYLQQCKIKGFEAVRDCTNLQALNLDGSTIDDEKVLSELRGKIPVSKKEEYLPTR